MSYYIVVKGTPGHAGVDVEGLDKKDEHYLALVDTLGFMMGEGGLVMKKPGSHGNCDALSCGTRVLILQPYMYPTDVLNALREAGFKILSSAGLPSGAVVWTLEKH